MPSLNRSTAPATQTMYLDMMKSGVYKHEIVNHLKEKLTSLNSKKMKQSYTVSGQRLSHKMSINVKHIQFAQRVSANHRPMMSVATFNQLSTLPRSFQKQKQLENHPLLNIHREQYALPLSKKHASPTLNPFTGRRVIFRKDLFDQSINVQYQKTILGIPFNISAENIDLDRNRNRPLHPGMHAGLPQNRIEDIHIVKVQRPVVPSASQPQSSIRS